MLSCLMKHFKSYWILMLGRLIGGTATSILCSGFETWLVSEHMTKNKFSSGLLGYMFGLMYTTMYIVAIFSGLLSQWVSGKTILTPISEGSIIHTGGFLAPFQVSMVCAIFGYCMIAFLWDENYGSLHTVSVQHTIRDAVKLVRGDSRVILLGIACACFEATMYAFVFNWTPALESLDTPPLHGLIFATFMMACMCGASTATIMTKVSPRTRVMIALLIGVFAFAICAVSAKRTNHLLASYMCFLVFEFCVGLYYPSMGVFKTDIVPDNVRSTIYNLYRIPLNAIVILLLLSNLPPVVSFFLCALLLSVALLAVAVITPWGTEDLAQRKLG